MTAKTLLQDEWIPLPPAVLTQLGWPDDARLELEVVDGVLVVTRVEAGPDAA